MLVSSHLLSEMELLADDVVIIAAGKLVRQGTVTKLLGVVAQVVRVRVRTPQPDELSPLQALSATVTTGEHGALLVAGVTRPTSARPLCGRCRVARAGHRTP